MDNLLFVSILQSSRGLSNVRQDACQGQARTLRMAFTQCAMGSIGHDQERDIVLRLNTKFEDTQNMLVIQCCDSACFVEKVILIDGCESGMQYLDACLRFKLHMFALVDINEATVPQQAIQTIVAN